MKVGIEVELHSDNYLMYEIADIEGLDFREFRTVDGSSIGVKMSEEYYPSTIEYNFTPFEATKENFDWVKSFLEKQIEKYRLYINCSSPSFVGTHIHIFDEDKLRLSKPRLLASVLQMINENILCLERKSIERLLLGHQLWGNWSHRNQHKWKKLLEINELRVNYYQSAGDRPKYQPIIRSAETILGKPESLEIRCIPNEFIMNGLAFQMINEIDNNTFYNREALGTMEFFYNIGKKIISPFMSLEDYDDLCDSLSSDGNEDSSNMARLYNQPPYVSFSGHTTTPTDSTPDDVDRDRHILRALGSFRYRNESTNASYVYQSIHSDRMIGQTEYLLERTFYSFNHSSTSRYIESATNIIRDYGNIDMSELCEYTLDVLSSFVALIHYSSLEKVLESIVLQAYKICEENNITRGQLGDILLSSIYANNTIDNNLTPLVCYYLNEIYQNELFERGMEHLSESSDNEEV